MPKKTIRNTKPSADAPKLDPMAEAERRIAERADALLMTHNHSIYLAIPLTTTD